MNQILTPRYKGDEMHEYIDQDNVRFFKLDRDAIGIDIPEKAGATYVFRDGIFSGFQSGD